MRKNFSPKEATEIAGISYRQLKWWRRTGLAMPTHTRNDKYSLYSLHDVVRLKLIVTLRNSMSIQQIHPFMKRIDKAIDDFGDLSDATLQIDPDTRCVLIHEGRGVLSPGPSKLFVQSRSWVRFSVADFYAEIAEHYRSPFDEARTG